MLGLIGCSGTTTDAISSISTLLNNIAIEENVTDVTPVSKTGMATLSWLPPTENTDGSTLTDLAGYKIYYGTSPSSLTNSITISTEGITEYVVADLLVNTVYYFTITSINIDNVESSFSIIVSQKIAG
jgi:hypothetical protein